jgi:hypothetical protein
MIFTIGYEGLHPQQLKRLAEKLDAKVIDVRGGRGRAKRGFGVNQLAELLGERYEWRGDRLGNFGGNKVTMSGIKELKADEQSGKNFILLCMEEFPGHCHRHEQICDPFFPNAIHIDRTDWFYAWRLTDAVMMGQEEYDIDGPDEVKDLPDCL